MLSEGSKLIRLINKLFRKIYIIIPLLMLFQVNNLSAQEWNDILKKVATDRATNDGFGYSVSISGSYAIVGAQEEDEDENGNNTLSNAGSAYLLKFIKGKWVEIKKLVASDRAIDDQFGFSVSISGDYAIVGSIYDDEDENGINTLANAGSVYIFKKDEGGTDNWGEIKKLVASDRTAGSKFGYSISNEGNLIIISAAYENSGGKAYIFEKDFGGVDNWGERKILESTDKAAGDLFGFSISIYGDYIVVSAVAEDEDEAGGNTVSNAGSIYLFKKDQGGVNNWGQLIKIVSPYRDDSDFFGHSVSIYGDYLVVGARDDDEDDDGDNDVTNAGGVYLFKKDQGGVDNWGIIKKFIAPVRNTYDYFGAVVAMFGNDIIVGAYTEDEDNNETNRISSSGSCYLYSKDQGGVDNWGLVKKIVAENRELNDRFGTSVSISDNFILVGVNFDDDDENNENSLIGSGSAHFIYRKNTPFSNDNSVTIQEDINYNFKVLDFPFLDIDGDTFAGISLESGTNLDNLEYNGIPVALGTDYPDVTKFVFNADKNGNGNSYTAFKFTVINNVSEYSLKNYAMTINIYPISDPPFLENLETEPMVYTEGESAKIITDKIKSYEYDDNRLDSAVVFIEGYQSGEDELHFENTSYITGDWDEVNGVLTLTGKTITYHFYTALRQVKYFNRSIAPKSNDRKINIYVVDKEGLSSDTLSRTILIKSINDTPLIASLPEIKTDEDIPVHLISQNYLNYISDTETLSENLEIIYKYTGYNLTLKKDSSTTVLIPNENWFGIDSILVKVNDEIDTANCWQIIKVKSVNDAPEFTNLPENIEFGNDASYNFCIWDCAEDVETPSNELKYKFIKNGGDIIVEYNNTTGDVKINSENNWSGETELFISVIDSDKEKIDDTVSIKIEDNITGVNEFNNEIPDQYTLSQNYPNPFNPSTIIKYGIPEESNVNLCIYNINGELVKELINKTEPAGYYNIRFDSNNMSSGIYIYRLSAHSITGTENIIQSKKMIFIK